MRMNRREKINLLNAIAKGERAVKELNSTMRILIDLGGTVFKDADSGRVLSPDDVSERFSQIRNNRHIKFNVSINPPEQ